MTSPFNNQEQPGSSDNTISQTRQQASGQILKHRAQTLPIGSGPVSSPGQATFLTSSPSLTSMNSSPDILHGYDGLQSGCVSPLQLPVTAGMVSPLPAGHSAMSEALQSKSPGLIRRLSGRAASRFVRARQSANNMRSRDQSSGPLVTRRRSGSKTGYDSDMTPNDGYSTVDDDLSPLDGKSNIIPSTPASTQSGSRKPSRAAEDYGPPVIHDDLRCGTRLMKVTRKKRKYIHLVLDPQAAKVTWNSMNKSLYIDDIQAIRVKGDAKKTRDDLSVPLEYESRWVTIVYADPHRSKGRPAKEMNLIFPPDEALFERWTTTLLKLYRYRHDLIVGLAGPGLDESTLRSRWKTEMEKVFQGQPRDTTQETLDFNGVERVCRSLNINWSTESIQHKFDKAVSAGSKMLNYEQFRAFVKDVKVRADVLERFQSLQKQNKDGLTLSEFLAFLQESQGVSAQANLSYWESVFFRFVQEDQHELAARPHETDPIMRFSAFNAFLSSTHNNVLQLESTEGKLDRPLNEYFISSSHNTYLLGRQVFGFSSVEGYRRTLQEGCRCVEIDCWDGGAEYGHQPVVTHGRTKTSKVLFAECVAIISKYAFEASPYPLILSLEVHCRASQQELMVSIMQKELGDRLVRDILDPYSDTLPSPEQLRGRILIKAKTGVPSSVTESESMFSTPVHTRQRSISSPAAQQHVTNSLLFQRDVSLPSPSSMSFLGNSSPSTPSVIYTPRQSSSSDDSDTEVHPATKSQGPKKPQRKIVESLDRLCVYTRGLKFRDFTSEATKSYNHIFSLAEGRFEKLCRDKEKNLLMEKHNLDCLMRVYPSGRRVLSTNFDPLQCWKKGVQMAALNCQTYDGAMQINEAMFAGNSDRSGYVLKPRNLRPLANGISQHIVDSLSPKWPRRIDLSITVISAQFLPRPRGQDGKVPSPYVEVQICIPDDRNTGMIQGRGGQEVQGRDKSASCQSHRRRTKIVPSNGYDPRFDSHLTFEITTKYPELVFIRWSVWNSSDTSFYNNNEGAVPEATFTAKLSSLQNGLRHLPLRNHLGEQFSFSTVFCEIRKSETREVRYEEPELPEKLGILKKAGSFVGGLKRNASSEKRKNSNS